MGIIIREGKFEDSEGIAKVHVDSWRETYKGIIPDSVLDGLSYEQRAEARRNHFKSLDPKNPSFCIYVAETSEGEIVGFSIGGPARQDPPQGFDGELFAIYLLKKYQGQGVGKKLFLSVKDWLKERKHKAMFLWVLKENETAKFYEAMGGKALTSKIIEIGKPLEEIAYGYTL